MATQETLEFEFADSDTYSAEMAELYSYSEEPELAENYRSFSRLFAQRRRIAGRWLDTDDGERAGFIQGLLAALEEAPTSSHRLSTVRALLYLAQGVWAECQVELDQDRWARHNCRLLIGQGAFSISWNLLSAAASTTIAGAAEAAQLDDCAELRALVNLMYTLVETARAYPDVPSANSSVREKLVAELADSSRTEPLPVLLLGMVTRYCAGQCSPQFPVKKLLLLMWKSTLLTLGSMASLHERRNAERQLAGLSPVEEVTQNICASMRPCSPPPTGLDSVDSQQQLVLVMPRRGAGRKSASASSASAAAAAAAAAAATSSATAAASESVAAAAVPNAAKSLTDTLPSSESKAIDVSVSSVTNGQSIQRRRVLPWQPKVSQRELQAYLQQVREKFLGFRAAAASANDTESLAGLPQPIHECVRVLKSHLYTSLTEVQIKLEEEIVRYPMTKGRSERVDHTPVETLYRTMLPCVPQYMIALLKILLAAAPTSKNKSESINLCAELIPEDAPNSLMNSQKFNTDVNRHKEIIAKAVSGFLLLLLKHLKLSHVYQFEYIAQHLVFANCIPLILKFFNQNVLSYVQSQNSIAQLEFPDCLFQSDDAVENAASSASTISWRNMFTCVCLARVLNKLTKAKHSRTMMLVVFKSAPIIKRALRVRHTLLQLYLLKLLKLQTKYLGRQWRKINMNLMSSIYEKVRHRLTDDWAFANDLDARPWDFQSEECRLRNAVDRFNQRRYGVGNGCLPEGYQPFDNDLSSVLSTEVALAPDFCRGGYELWLEREVFSTPINWDLVLQRIVY